MIDPIVPAVHWRVKQETNAPYRIEQHEEEQAVGELSNPNLRWYHDPLWRTRFLSITHIRECQEGKQFSWFWTPMSEVFNLSQVMFLILPFAAAAKSGGGDISMRGLILTAMSLMMLMSAAKYILRWYHEWRFRHIPYTIIRH
jgi:hypothetical protein